jgi:Protein NO VEIN, C-terminal
VATETPAWADATGLPTGHAVRAALHVAATIDERGSRVVDAYESYWHKATGGVFAPPDLERGQRLLVDCRLVEEREGTLYPLPALQQMLLGTADDAVAAIYARAVEQCAEEATWSPDETDAEIAALIPDPARREELLLALARRFDDAQRRLIGAIGEELVVAALRADLVALGYPELAREVRHVSLESDMLGYDVTAPRVAGQTRLLEVKSTTAHGEETITFHLSRNEAETGLRYRDWALVVCAVTDASTREGEVVGWQSAAALAPAFPIDSPGGRWESVAITVAFSDLLPGLPPAVV